MNSKSNIFFANPKGWFCTTSLRSGHHTLVTTGTENWPHWNPQILKIRLWFHSGSGATCLLPFRFLCPGTKQTVPYLCPFTDCFYVRPCVRHLPFKIYFPPLTKWSMKTSLKFRVKIWVKLQLAESKLLSLLFPHIFNFSAFLHQVQADPK